MRKSVYLIICCCLLCLGCQEELETTSNGSLNIFLTDEVATTRTLPDALSDELIQQFDISLLRDRKGAIITEYSGFLKDFGDNRILKVGTYRATASYGEDVILALDAPYYYGEVEDVSIKKNKATSITIACKVANSLATFEIVNPAIFEKYLKDYYVEIKVGEESVRWQAGDTTHPYFKSGSSVQLVLKGTSTTTGEECSYTLSPIDEVVAGMKYKYKLKISPSNVGLEVETEQQQEPVTINETVPVSWLPAPKVSSDNFDEEHILRYTETADAAQAVITFSAFRPVQEVEFTLNFVDEHLKHLNKTYVLSELSVEDRQMLEAAGIVLPDLSTGITIGNLDFTGVTSGLLTHNGGQDVDNTIAIKVKANDRLSEETVYTIRTVKPEFIVEVRKGNVWTKEFSIEEASIIGNANRETILNNIKYQYSEDGGVNWIDFPERIKMFNSYPLNREYKVRGVYKDISSEIVDVVLEIPEQLPNSEMEEWNYESLIKDKSMMYFPYIGENSFWNTNNSFTTRYRNNTLGKPYNCFPAVSYTKDAHKGEKAAELRNTAAGRGNTSFIGHTELSMNKVPGELFIGDISVTTGGNDASPSGDHYTIVKGKEFSSRPTALYFWYKYIPYNSDAWEASIALYDDDRNLIIENTITYSDIQNAFAPCKISLNYQKGVYYEACKYIYVSFKSTITSGDSLPYEKKNVSLWVDDEEKTYKDTYVGSTLIIDDISLIYDR